MAPGAMHQARWMSKIIYSFKIWMFRSQFTLTAREEKGLRELCIFFARVYVKAWYTAPLPTAAPNNDLQLLKSLSAYSTINAAISKAASRKMADHLWYLSETLVGLAFFDSSVSCEIKDKMVTAMFEVDGEDDSLKRVKINDISFAMLENLLCWRTNLSLTLSQKLRNHCSKSSDCLWSSFSCQHHSGQRIVSIRLLSLLPVLLLLSVITRSVE